MADRPQDPAPAPGDGDVWAALDELAGLINDIASEVAEHAGQLHRLLPTDPEKAKAIDAAELRTWVEALVDEYGLHGEIGPPERWESIPPVRAELIGLKIADVRNLRLPAGSFELVYWHDALARVIGRIVGHVDRWQRDQQDQSLLRQRTDGRRAGDRTIAATDSRAI